MTRPLLGAHLSGFSAFVIEMLLLDHLPARIIRHRELVEQGKLDQARLTELVRTWATIRAASAEWKTWRSSVGESTEDPPMEVLPGSAEIDTATAATILQVTESRVRQLARNGQIGARRVGRTWLVSRPDIELRRQAA